MLMNNRFCALGAFANISESLMALDFQSCMLRRDCGPTPQTCSDFLRICREVSPNRFRTLSAFAATFLESLPNFAATAVDPAMAAGAAARLPMTREAGSVRLPMTREAGSVPRNLILCLAVT